MTYPPPPPTTLLLPSLNRYGKTVVSDPRRASRLLKVLKALETADSKAEGKAAAAAGGGDSGSGNTGRGRAAEEAAAVPTAAADQDAWLQWGYYEATALVRQYGGLLEEVKAFLGTGTSTVGECALLIEEQLR